MSCTDYSDSSHAGFNRGDSATYSLARRLIAKLRDLGSIPAGDRVTQLGRYFRSPRLDSLSSTGWRALLASGVSTVIDLRNGTEDSALTRPDAETTATSGPFVTTHLPIEDQDDADFMSQWAQHLGTPAYYADVLRRWPEKIAAVFQAFATAPVGGVLFHCSAGRDRTGMITAMLLALAGVSFDDIADDYELSVRAMNVYAALGLHPTEHALDETSLEHAIALRRSQLMTFLADLAVRRYLTDASLSDVAIRDIRGRLLEPRDFLPVIMP